MVKDSRGGPSLILLLAFITLAACGVKDAVDDVQTTDTSSSGGGSSSGGDDTSSGGGSSGGTGSSSGGSSGGDGSSSGDVQSWAVPCGSGPFDHELTITGSPGSFAFSPSSLSVVTGETLRWTNNTAVAHTVTNDPVGDAGTGDLFDENIAAAATVCVRPTTAMTVTYFCRPHPSMEATLTVSAN